MLRKSALLSFIFACQYLTSSPALADTAKTKLSITSGAHFLRGDYDNDVRTEMRYYPLTLKYRHGPWRYALTLAYLDIEGPRNLVAGVRGAINADPLTSQAQAKRSESGIADILAKVSYTQSFASQQPLWGTAQLKLKHPAGDEKKGLSTGETDYSAQYEIMTLHGKWAPFATLGYKRRGDLHYTSFDQRDGISRQITTNLQDGFYGSIGFTHLTGKTLSWGGFWDAREAANSENENPQEIILYGQYKAEKHWKLSAYAGAGLNDNSSDLLSGIQLTYEF